MTSKRWSICSGETDKKQQCNSLMKVRCSSSERRNNSKCMVAQDGGYKIPMSCLGLSIPGDTLSVTTVERRSSAS